MGKFNQLTVPFGMEQPDWGEHMNPLEGLNHLQQKLARVHAKAHQTMALSKAALRKAENAAHAAQAAEDYGRVAVLRRVPNMPMVSEEAFLGAKGHFPPDKAYKTLGLF